MSKLYVLLCVYLAFSGIYTLWMIYTLWQDDRRLAQKPYLADKFGFNFRKHGRFDGRFAITSTAMILIGITLPVINIITLIIYLLPVIRACDPRDPTHFD